MTATTTIAEGLAIIVFATVLFLLGMGAIALLKLLLRAILRTPRPVAAQGVSMDFEMSEAWKRDADDEGELDETENGGGYEMKRFASYLESRIHSEQLGDFDGGVVEGMRVRLYFYGPDAKRIWERIEGDVLAYSPAKLREVRFDFGGKRGSSQVVSLANDTPQHSEALPDFEIWNRIPVVSRAWLLVIRLGLGLTAVGFLGLFLSWLVQRMLGMSEQVVMQTRIGSFIIFTLSGMFIGGMILCLVFSCRVQRLAKRPGPGPVGRAMQGPVLPGWISNKVILAITAAAIIAVLMWLRGW